jgi:hypothetical protein
MRALRSEFADPTILAPDLIQAGAPSVRRCDVDDLDGGSLWSPSPLHHTLGATAVIAMFALALIGVIR